MVQLAEQLEKARSADTAAAEADLDRLWSAIEPETVGARPTWRSRLRELPTAWRVGLCLAGAIAFAVVLMLVLGGARGDIVSAALVGRYALAMSGLSVLAGAVFAVVLRGAHQRPIGRVAWVVVGLAVALPLLLSLMPSLWQPSVSAEHALQPMVIDGCNIIGIATGLFAAVLAWGFQRSTTPVPARVLGSAAGGGVIAFAMLQLHCPADDVEHLVLGHSIVGVILVALAGLGLGLRRVLARRSSAASSSR